MDQVYLEQRKCELGASQAQLVMANLGHSHACQWVGESAHSESLILPKPASEHSIFFFGQ